METSAKTAFWAYAFHQQQIDDLIQELADNDFDVDSTLAHSAVDLLEEDIYYIKERIAKEYGINLEFNRHY